MNQLTERRMPRLGVVVVAVTLMVLSLAAFAPFDASEWPSYLVLGLIGATGIGLLFRARFARVLGIGGALVAAVLGPRAFYQVVSDVGGDWDVTLVLAVANAAATTLLGVWLALRAVLLLADRTRSASPLTARLIGGTLAIVAIDHLWVAYLVGFHQPGFSIHIAADGTQLLGFPGWPIWHGALLLVALTMAFAPKRMLGAATTALMVLAFALVPLVIAMMITAGGMFAEMFVFMVAMALFIAYLAWWLRDESRSAAL